jgi:hypothetical protein
MAGIPRLRHEIEEKNKILELWTRRKTVFRVYYRKPWTISALRCGVRRCRLDNGIARSSKHGGSDSAFNRYSGHLRRRPRHLGKAVLFLPANVADHVVRDSSGIGGVETEIVRNCKRDQDKICLFPHRPSPRRLAGAGDSFPWPWVAQEPVRHGCRISARARNCCALASPGV